MEIAGIALGEFNLFEWAKKTYPQKIKKRLCLDCGQREMILKFNEGKGIYEGNRVCYTCSKSHKRKYFGG